MKSYYAMISRCYNYKDKNYKNYGERGISVCNEWIDDANVFIKWALENGWDKKLSLDRINNNGNYEPNNLRWADAITQQNNKRNTVIVEFNGDKIPLSILCRKLKLNRITVWRRIKYLNWSLEDALYTPIIKLKTNN